MVMADSMARAMSASLQPKPSRNTWPSGTISTCPEDPPAPARPRKRLRRDSSTLRATTARSTGKPVPLNAMPMRMPLLRTRSGPVEAWAIMTRPTT
jgi:hypothetical protein